MTCPYCKAQIPDDGKFCPKCGHRYRNWKKILIVAGASLGTLCIVAVSGIGVNAYVQHQNILSDYKMLLTSGDYSAAKEAYRDSNDYDKANQEVLQTAVDNNDKNLVISLLESGLYDEAKAEKAATYICDILNNLFDQYESLDISYNTIQNDIATYLNIDNNTISQTCQSIQSEIESLHQKRAKYEQGVHYMEEANYTSAIGYFKEIEETDELYSEAQALISQCMGLYKEQTTALEEEFRSEHKYSALLQRLNYLQAYSPTEERSQKIEEITEEYKNYSKETQLITVSSGDLKSQDGLYLFNIELTNHSDKEVTKATISILCFDENGEPVGQKSNLVSHQMFVLGLAPGETHNYTEIREHFPDGCTQIKICINTVHFRDSTTWTNDYHKFWLEENKDHY